MTIGARVFLAMALHAWLFGLSQVADSLLFGADRKLSTVQRLEEGKPVTIVCFGDSITGVYYHTGGQHAWCDVLGITLKNLYPKAQLEMINAGISGNDTAAALKRMETDVLRHNPQLVAVMFGMNDLVRQTPAAFHDNLTEIVKRSRDRGAETVLMTPNSIYPDDARRPPWRVAQFAEIVRQVGREVDVPVSDCFRAYEAIRAVDRRAWIQLMSDNIHPNMRGHKLFAEEVAWTISGKRNSPPDVTPLQARLPRTLARLREDRPFKLTAMPPYDGLMVSALQRSAPGKQVSVTPWDVAGKSLAGIEEQAKEIGWRRFRTGTEPGAPDLVVVAIPPAALAPDEEDFFRYYTSILNLSLGYGKLQWDCIVILPSVLQPDLDPGQRAAENLALEAVKGQGICWLQRQPGESAPAEDLLQHWLASLLAAQ
ncbi:MAG: hypothetical protein FJW26_15985 [Acidimicrobiia bacterium]|nr:hypothetical protein [Acidimicrobiia bacterium]